MTSLRQYYETDLSHTLKLHASLLIDEARIDVDICYDYNAYTQILSVYVPEAACGSTFVISILREIINRTSLNLCGTITTPTRISNLRRTINIQETPSSIIALMQHFGESRWIASTDIEYHNRIFLYTERKLEELDAEDVLRFASNKGVRLQLLSKEYAETRSASEIPLAFISYDSRDRNDVARPIASTLQKMMCPVWYDEFSLKIGDSLRQGIESGLRSCRKCVVILSRNFLENRSWGRKELDAIFARETMEQKRFILPIRYGVSEEDVFQYSPILSLRLVQTAIPPFDEVNRDEVCRWLYDEIAT